MRQTKNGNRVLKLTIPTSERLSCRGSELQHLASRSKNVEKWSDSPLAFVIFAESACQLLDIDG
ncbi:MAG: hypothetical protein ACUVQ3_06730 [bacterium]